MKLQIFTYIMMFIFSNLWAAETLVQNKIKKRIICANIDFISSHVWRGGKSGHAPAIEPLLEISSGNLTLGTWAATTFDKQYKELDIYAIYNIHNFSVGVFDYFCPPQSSKNIRFIDVQKSNTHHLYSIDFTFNGTKKLPLRFTASTMLYGMDYDTQTGTYYFSTYLESKYTKNWKNNSITAACGFTTHEGIYYNKPAFVNTELMYKKTFGLKHFDLPFFGKVIYNPATQKSFIIGGISIKKSYNI